MGVIVINMHPIYIIMVRYLFSGLLFGWPKNAGSQKPLLTFVSSLNTTPKLKWKFSMSTYMPNKRNLKNIVTETSKLSNIGPACVSHSIDYYYVRGDNN